MVILNCKDAAGQKIIGHLYNIFYRIFLANISYLFLLIPNLLTLSTLIVLRLFISWLRQTLHFKHFEIQQAFMLFRQQKFRVNAFHLMNDVLELFVIVWNVYGWRVVILLACCCNDCLFNVFEYVKKLFLNIVAGFQFCQRWVSTQDKLFIYEDKMII